MKYFSLQCIMILQPPGQEGREREIKKAILRQMQRQSFVVSMAAWQFVLAVLSCMSHQRSQTLWQRPITQKARKADGLSPQFRVWECHYGSKNS